VPGAVNLLGSLNQGNTLRIGDNFSGTVSLPANGLKGQIIVNADNNSTPGTWTGTVNVGTIQLKPNNTASPQDTAPYYRRLPSELGGGSVGLAPYHLHINASFPEHRDSENVVPTGEDIFEANIADQSVQAIVLPFYSPIVRGSGYANCGSAFEIRCRPLSAGATRAIGSWSAMGSTFMGRVIQVGRNLGRSDFHAKMVIFPSLGFTELFLL